MLVTDEKRPLLGMNPPVGYFRGCNDVPHYIEGWAVKWREVQNELIEQYANDAERVRSILDAGPSDTRRALEAKWEARITGATEHDYFLNAMLIIAGLGGLVLVGIVAWGIF